MKRWMQFCLHRERPIYVFSLNFKSGLKEKMVKIRDKNGHGSRYDSNRESTLSEIPRNVDRQPKRAPVKKQAQMRTIK